MTRRQWSKATKRVLCAPKGTRNAREAALRLAVTMMLRQEAGQRG